LNPNQNTIDGNAPRERDPVCGMEVPVSALAVQYEYRGRIYYFCTTLCRILFENDPEEYISQPDSEEVS
jgi:YHS domain-containing protein